MRLMRHKTKHRPFAVGLPVLSVLQLAAVCGFLYWYLTWTFETAMSWTMTLLFLFFGANFRSVRYTGIVHTI